MSGGIGLAVHTATICIGSLPWLTNWKGRCGGTSTVQGACRTAAAAFADRERAEVRQVVIESDHGYVLIVPTDHGSCVAAYGDGEVRLDMLAHRVHSQVARLGEKAMAAAPRGADGGASA